MGTGGGEWPQLLEPVAHFGVFRWTEGGREVRSGAWSGREREREVSVKRPKPRREEGWPDGVLGSTVPFLGHGSKTFLFGRLGVRL